MKILYGVVGDGMGHAIRSSVVVEHLLDEGHQVHLVASARAVPYLEQRFGEITEIWGLSLVMEHNIVSKRLTAATNLKNALKGFPANVRRFFEVETEFMPDVVISDFETWSWVFGKLHNVPVICLDNIQVINRCEHDEDIIAGAEDDFQIAKSVVKARAPGAAHYLITTFFHPPVRKKRTTLVPPVLRDNILEATPSEGEHVLVYQTSETFEALPGMLKELGVPAYIYGLKRDIDEDERDENLTYRPFSDDQFVADLASCRGVIASAGFTLVTEALHLGKPYLATPVGNQFEQLMNARYVDKLGYGTYYEDLDVDAIRHFLDKMPDYRAALDDYPSTDNQETFQRLAELFDEVEAGLV